jgi:hypothetical protein
VFLFPVLLFGLAGLSGLRGIYQALVADSVLFAVVTLAVFLSIRRGYIREAEVVPSMDLERAARS